MDWVSFLLEYCVGKLSMVGGILGRQAPWSLMVTVLEVLKLGAPHPVYPLTFFLTSQACSLLKSGKTFPVTSLILLPREESDLQS